MPKISPFLRNLIIVFLFFVIGRFLVVQLGANGSWIVIGGVIIFYIVWWNNYQQNKKKPMDTQKTNKSKKR
ncbi:MAG: hypothetical protein Fur0022_10200 [Anaerolineales bacterium]